MIRSHSLAMNNTITGQWDEEEAPQPRVVDPSLPLNPLFHSKRKFYKLKQYYYIKSFHYDNVIFKQRVLAVLVTIIKLQNGRSAFLGLLLSTTK